MCKDAQICMDSVVRQGILQLEHRDVLHVDWQVLQRCNYKCSYCFSPKKPVTEHYDRNLLFKTVDNIIALGRPYYSFRLLGGEPTIFPYLRELVDYVYSVSRNVGILMITNGSRSPRYFYQLLNKVPVQSADIHISIHLEYAQFEHIENVIFAIADMGQSATVRFMYNPELKDKARHFHEKMVSLRVRVPFQMRLRPLRRPPEFVELDPRYTADDLQWMNMADAQFDDAARRGQREIPKPDWGMPIYQLRSENCNVAERYISHSEAMRTSLTAFKGYFCCAGTNTLTIWKDFSWKTATCSAIREKDFYVHDEKFLSWDIDVPIVCPLARCGCDANFGIPKFKNKIEALLFCRDYLERVQRYKSVNC